MITGLLLETAFLTEKPFRVSHTGVMKLRESSFKSRYQGGNKRLFSYLPNGKVIKTPPAPPDPGSKDKIKISTNLKKEGDPLILSNKERGNYTINKKVIRNRVLSYSDMIRRSKKWKRKELFFWTVTFPPCINDTLAYRLLNTWLTHLRSTKMLHSYLWVAERQENGTVHFHILIPHWMNVKIANRLMMVSICSLVRKKEISLSLSAAKRYNGVDIAKDRKTRAVVNFMEKKKSRSLTRYITKYITKNNSALPHLAWNCSTDWSIPFFGVALTRAELVTIVTSREQLKPDFFVNEYIEFWRWKQAPPWSMVNHLAQVNFFMVADYFESIGKGSIFLN